MITPYRLCLIFIFTLCSIHVCAANAEISIDEPDIINILDNVLGPDIIPESEIPWHFVFDTNGRFWVWQAVKHDPIVTWDYGANVMMEIARGRGHRLWFGAEYRMAAGYKESQRIIPFDPRQIDTHEAFAWRWAFKKRQEVFVHMRRMCYHRVDLHYSAAVTWTHAAFGFGTISPAEDGEHLSRVRKRGKPQFDGFLSFGPFLHGGKMEFFGNAPSFQWEGMLYGSWSYPFTKNNILETSVKSGLQIVSDYEDQNRYMVYVRQAIIAQRDRGGLTLFIDRNIHDDYIQKRSYPVSWRFGLEHRF
ncbi:MAG: hypothetical protein P9L92_07690 [Candidatus Electryonea clarkiae]|nr:hypothetical protein [Candidatus Electryonea clarkiae]MDP8285023.1 hypothetical protein [Candidatus Electryonea clarkiae]